MAGGGAGASLRRGESRLGRVRTLVRDTQRALSDLAPVLTTDQSISVTVQETGTLASRPSALVICGTSSDARARLLHTLLGTTILPEPLPRGIRWIRVQYGTSRQAQLTLGNSEFELVDELHCACSQWETIPEEDLIRQGPSDLTTILDIQVKSQFLKVGHRMIIMLPDLEDEPPPSTPLDNLKQSELYLKRSFILSHYNPIFLYAIDKIGKNVFFENFCDNMNSFKSDDDFWSTYNLYYMTRSDSFADRSSIQSIKDEISERKVVSCYRESSDDPFVFTNENCLDLQQIKELDPNAQVLFILYSDSGDMSLGEQSNAEDVELEVSCDFGAEATESTEDYIYHSEELPESDQSIKRDFKCNPKSLQSLYEKQVVFMNEMIDQWELTLNTNHKSYIKNNWMILDLGETPNFKNNNNVISSQSSLINRIIKFSADVLQGYVLDFCTTLREIHVTLVQQLVGASFSLARELQLLPAKVQYCINTEQELYKNITEKFSLGLKEQQLVQLMKEVIEEMASDVKAMDWSVDNLPCHQDRTFLTSNSTFYGCDNGSGVQESLPLTTFESYSANEESGTPVEQAVSYESYNFDDYDIINSVERAASQYCDREDSESNYDATIYVENESDVFSIRSSLNRDMSGTSKTYSTASDRCSSTYLSIKQASLDVQKTVLTKLSRKISLKLVNFVDCLRDSYFGTLQRCLESLEASCREELSGRPASEAMRQVVCVARQVDLQCCASFPLLRTLIESLRRIFNRLRLGGGGGSLQEEEEEACCVLSAAWRRKAAFRTVGSLSANKLARVISTQILERVGVAHTRYQTALNTLQTALSSRLLHSEDLKRAIRKRYAPMFARLCLESTSLCDLLLYGMPDLGKEIGRGHYGVVFACRGSWAGRAPCAAKSVVAIDERHISELAMELFYARAVPPHPRLVTLYGSVLSEHSPGGSGSGSGSGSVLLVSQRFARDLHAAVRAGLALDVRMRISADIVHGIRYLHSLGLVHRDIKLKNVVLNNNNRAALTDLGFCSAQALVSGSVVGTPVHMAPELLGGDYDHTVDIYAFGVLFWYVCAGNIKLPSAFEVFQNKEQLWSKVKRGLRPERLSHFADSWWQIMEACWAEEPSKRPLLGDVQSQLENIIENLDPDLVAPTAAKNDDSQPSSIDLGG